VIGTLPLLVEPLEPLDPEPVVLELDEDDPVEEEPDEEEELDEEEPPLLEEEPPLDDEEEPEDELVEEDPVLPDVPVDPVVLLELPLPPVLEPVDLLGVTN